MAEGPPGIAPGIARHCSRQVVLANWIYDMMCVCCVSLSLSRSLSSPSGDLTGNAVQIARGPPGIAPGIAAGIVYGKWSEQIARGPRESPRASLGIVHGRWSWPIGSTI